MTRLKELQNRCRLLKSPHLMLQIRCLPLWKQQNPAVELRGEAKGDLPSLLGYRISFLSASLGTHTYL